MVRYRPESPSVKGWFLRSGIGMCCQFSGPPCWRLRPPVGRSTKRQCQQVQRTRSSPVAAPHSPGAHNAARRCLVQPTRFSALGAPWLRAIRQRGGGATVKGSCWGKNPAQIIVAIVPPAQSTGSRLTIPSFVMGVTATNRNCNVSGRRLIPVLGMVVPASVTN
jgi:hypothetical protein